MVLESLCLHYYITKWCETLGGGGVIIYFSMFNITFAAVDYLDMCGSVYN